MAISNLFYQDLKTCRYLLKMAYIGTNYKGVQRVTQRINENEEDGTIQCAIERAANRALCPVYGTRLHCDTKKNYDSAVLALSSRTDAGVHAYQNYANCDLTHPFGNTIYKPLFVTEAINRVLTENEHEITILESRIVPSRFHSRINAKWRAYVYRFAMIHSVFSPSDGNSKKPVVHYHTLRSALPLSQINRCHAVSYINLDLAQQCITLMRGEHDFVSFSTKSNEKIERSTVKNIEQLELRPYHPLTSFELTNETYANIQFFEIHIKSKSFLYNQVRRMVTAILDVGSGRISLTDIEKMFNCAPWKPPSFSKIVPACGKRYFPSMLSKTVTAIQKCNFKHTGLYLVEVGYDQTDFELTGDYTEFSPKSYYCDNTFDDIQNFYTSQ